VYKKVLEAGGHPMVSIGIHALQDYFYRYAQEHQLNYLCPINMKIMSEFDALIAIGAGENTKSLTDVPNEKIQMVNKSDLPISKVFHKRSAAHELAWVCTRGPVPSFAQDASMSTLDYEDFVYRSVGALEDDPIAFWEAVSVKQQVWTDYLNKVKYITFIGPNCKLSCSVKGRKWINCDGHFNMPDGEVFTSPVEDTMNGWVKFTYPAIYQGNEVTGVEIKFEAGKAVKATAESGEEFLNAMLDTDEQCRYLGELAVGTNENITRFTKSILYDEKMSKTIHMAFGAGYLETGSKQEDAAIHWDMICDMSDGEIYADGDLIYKNGDFLIQ
jgi:aminopeptidase